MAIFPLKELIRIARARSEFYRELYAHLPQDVMLEQLPVLDQTEFWAANNFHRNRLLTASPRDGIVFKSGGTTGNPKFSLYTRQEWRVFTSAFGRALSSGSLRGAERVANLFYAGELYASFLFIHESLENAADPTLNFPVSGASAPETIVAIADELKIDTLAGVPTTLLAISDFLARTGGSLPSVKRLLYGGESIYPDQRRHLQQTFPGADILSVGYASVDAGLLGYADESCGPDEHRAFDETILELIDEDTGESISEMDRPGKVVITNLTRTLMPIIRYPAGDRAVWAEQFSPTNRNRRFRLLGRSEEGARVGPATLYFEDVQKVLSHFQALLRLRAFQMVVRHEDGRDRLTVRLGVADPAAVTPSLLDELHRALLTGRPILEELTDDDKIHPIAWEAVEPGQLTVNARTGKMRRVLDLRHIAN